MAKSTVAHDSVHSFAFQVAGVAMGFVTSWIISRLYGPEGKGVLAFLASTLTVSTVAASLGFATAATRLVGQRRYPASTISAVQLAAGIVVGLVLAGVLALYLPPYQERLSLPTAALAPYIAAVVLALLALNLNGILFGKGEVHLSNQLNAVGVWLWTLSTLAFLAVGDVTLSRVVAIWIAGQCLGSAALVAVVLRRNPPSLTSFREAGGETVRFGIEAYAANVIWILVLRIDAQLLLLWSNAAQLGLYSIGVALAEALWHFPRAMNQAAVAKIAGGGRADALSLSLRTVRIGVFLTVIFGTLLALIARPLVLWVYGDAFEGSVACLLFLLPGMVGNAMAGPLGLFLSQQLGLPRHNAINSAIVLVVNIALNAVWIPRWGAVGAAAASSVTYLLMGLLAALRVRREPEFGWRRLLVVQKDDLRLMKSSLQALVSRGKR